MLALPGIAEALTISGTGVILKNGGKILVTSTETLSAAKIYTVTLDLSGSATGGIAEYLGPGTINLRTALTNTFGATIATSALGSTLANLSGKLPAALAVGPASQYYYVVSGTTVQSLETKGVYSLKLDKAGKFTGRLSHLTVSILMNRKKQPLTGDFVATSGSVTVLAVGASSLTPQPDIMVMGSPRVVIGCNQFFTSGADFGAYKPFYTKVAKGSAHSFTLLVLNDGPSTDTFLLESGSIPAGFTVTGHDGKKPITSSEFVAGYSITLGSGALKPINVTVKAVDPIKLKYYILPFSAQRAANSSVIDWAGLSIYVP